VALRSEIWLGDALRLSRTLSLDSEATLEMLGLLGLRPADAAASGAARADTQHETPEIPPPAVAPPGGRSGIAAEPRISEQSSTLTYSLLDRLDTRAQPPLPPDWWRSQEPLSPAKPPRTDPPRPLFSRLQRRSIVSYAIGREVPEGPLDIDAIARTIGRGRPLRGLPRRPRRTLRYGVEVLVDRARWMEPFYRDQDGLLDYLETLLPPERVHVRQMRGEPPSGRELRNTEASGVHAYAAVLALTDLGAGSRAGIDTRPSPRDWLRTAREVRQVDRALVVFTPYARSRWPGPLRRALAILQWSERTTAGHARRLRHGGRLEYPPRRREREDAHVRDLARALSTAARIDPWLLREARLGLVPQSDPASEADLWFSALIASRGPGGVVLKPHVIEELRLELAQLDPAFVRSALKLVERAHARYPEVTRIEEALAALAVSAGVSPERVDALLRPALKALQDRQSGGARPVDVARWAAHAWARFPKAVRSTDAARQLALATALTLGENGWMQKRESAELPAEPAWLLPETAAENLAHGIELRQFADGEFELVVTPPREQTSARHVIRAPKTQPALLEVRAHAREDSSVGVLALEAGATLPLGLHTPEIVLRTLRGEEYRLRSASAGEIAERCLVEIMFDEGARGPPPLTGVYVGGGLVITAELGGDQPTVHVRVPGGKRYRALAYRGRDVDASGRSTPAAWAYLRIADDPAAGEEQHALVGIDLNARAAAAMPALGDGDSAQEAHVFFLNSGSVRQTRPRMLDSASIAFDDAPDYPAGGLLLDLDVAAGPAIVLRGESLPLQSMAVQQQMSNREASSTIYRVASLRGLVERARQQHAENWTLHIAYSRDQHELAHICGSILRERLGARRVVLDTEDLEPGEDGTQATIGALRAADALLVIGDPNDPGTRRDVEHACSASMPSWWLPPEDAERALAALPDELATYLREHRWGGGAPQDLKQAAYEIAEAIVGWRPGERDRAPDEEQHADSAPEPSIVRSERGVRVEILDRFDNAAHATNLYRVPLLERFSLRPFVTPGGTEPILVLVHADGGSGSASFGNLWDASNEGYRQRLHARYGARVLSFEYHGVTRGLIDNALELAQRLPRNATLDLLTFGGGGIIGELLGRVQREDASEPFDERDYALLRERGLAVSEVALRDLAGVLREKRFRIERFVRVGCPARGSTIWSELAAKPLSWLETVGDSFMLLWPVTKLLKFGAQKLLLDMLNDDTRAPGLTQLTPASPIIALINRPGLRLGGELAVVAGAHEGRGVIGTLRGFAFRRLLDAGADLVVPFDSNFGGAARSGGAYRFVDRGPEVTYFNYFRNHSSLERIVGALLTGAAGAQLEAFELEPPPMASA
jgi:hypothetical protein